MCLKTKYLVLVCIRGREGREEGAIGIRACDFFNLDDYDVELLFDRSTAKLNRPTRLSLSTYSFIL